MIFSSPVCASMGICEKPYVFQIRIRHGKMVFRLRGRDGSDHGDSFYELFCCNLIKSRRITIFISANLNPFRRDTNGLPRIYKVQDILPFLHGLLNGPVLPRNVALPHIHFPRIFPFDGHLSIIRRVLSRLNCHVFHGFILRRTAVSICQKLNFNRLSINVIRTECLPRLFFPFSSEFLGSLSHSTAFDSPTLPPGSVPPPAQ